MAKTIGDLLIKLGVDGIEGVEALKGSLRGLSKAAGPTDKNIRKIRTEILEFANAGNQSTQAIRGVIESFKGLQAQASINSTVYKQLAADIDGLESSLQALKPDADQAAEALERLKRVGTPSKAMGDFEKNMERRRQQLKDLKVDTEEYLEALVGIKNFEAQQAARVARQEVSAQARVARTGLYRNIVEADQPATLAALRLRIGEVQSEIENLDFTTTDYIDANRELVALQKSLNEALDGTASSFDRLGREQETAARRAKKLSDIQQYYGTSKTPIGQAAQRAGGFRDPVTGAMIARGTVAGRVSLAQQPMREISGLYRSIGDIGMSGIAADIDRMGKSYEDVTRDIQAATLASNGSINSLQAQRASWASLRAGLDPASKAYRDVGREIEKVDQRLEKLNRRRRRPTLGGAAQVLGGVAAGGVFGGAEGAIGAAAGAPFGVGGVAAGAAIGAQVKVLREALGATSDYAAEVRKLEIALEGAAGAQFPEAMKAAADVTKELNVPQEVAIRGMTRLTAAVVGAEGSVADAEIVFRNITQAIKATGGGAQDVESAITAMVQTFSKGKVSAEELSGQLGERLPAAVTQFAKANNMTLPELQKAFKAGTVGLNQLMTFVESLGPKYAKIARDIADSSVDAGARSAVAFNEMRLEVGKALQPIGAQLQDAFVKFATDSLPALIKASKASATAINALLDVGAFLIANFDKLAASALVLGAAVGTAGLVKAAINAGSAMNALQLALFNVRLAVAGLSKAIAFLAANPIILLVAGITAAGVALYRAATANDRFVKSIDDGNTTLAEAKTKTEEVYEEINKLQERLDKTSNKRLIQSLRRQMRNLYDDVDDLNNAIERAIYRDFGGGEGFQGPVISGMKRTDELPPATRKPFPDPDDEDDADSGSAKVMMTQAELDLRNKIRQARLDENKLLESSLTYDLDVLIANRETEDLLARTNEIQQAGFDLVVRGRDIRKEAASEAEREAEAEALRLDKIQQARVLAGEITQEEYDRKKTLDEMAILLKDKPELYAKIKEKLEEAATPLGRFKARLKEVFEEAMNLKDALADKAVQAVQTLGDTFADFVATGKADFADMTASILRDLSRIFARAALFKGLSLIPGVGSFLGLASKGAVIGGTGGPPTTMPDSVSLVAANGMAFAKNKIVPYAKGGIVEKPTLFKYAQGGSGRFGLMGEAGPEAIMPLRRDRNGKLGVESSGGVGNVVVNVNATGSKVQGDQPNAKALGSAIGAAVQAELIKQKRPGGLLS